MDKMTKKFVEYENKKDFLQKMSYECLRKRFELIKQVYFKGN